MRRDLSLTGMAYSLRVNKVFFIFIRLNFKQSVEMSNSFVKLCLAF